MARNNHKDLLQALEFIDPSELEYGEWLAVGQGLKHEGYDVEVWDEWSQNDTRYRFGECEAKWETFDDSNAIQPITGATIAAMAISNGWEPYKSNEPEYTFGFDDEVKLVDPAYVEAEDIEPLNMSPVEMMTTYLQTVFDTDDIVCYVIDAYQREDSGKWTPTGGIWGRTAGQIIEALENCNGDIGAAIGDYEPAAGAWICINPVDGHGRKNEHITDYRYMLVESDTDDLEQQFGIMKALNLPLVAVVSSGSRSIHGIVHVDARDMRQYKERVDRVFEECRKAGLHVDASTKNPSRLSRLPGVYRNGNLQALIATNIGAADYVSWLSWLEDEQDDLPDFDNFADAYDNPPQLADALIDGILRIGHKAILAGPSKAGKSFYLMELALAIANGDEWAGHKCRQGRVLYINLEIDAPSAIDRLRRIRDAKETDIKNNRNIDLWNLRGKAAPIEKLAPKIIRRALKYGHGPQDGGFSAIIIDPIYKIQAGDENAAGDLSRFTNELDRIANETAASVIFCHHQSKGYQGNKSSIDRMSGSGVLARDPDAIIDMVQVDMTSSERERSRDRKLWQVLQPYIDEYDIQLPDDTSPRTAREIIYKQANRHECNQIQNEYDHALDGIENVTAWRVTFTLREFANVRTQNVWFDYPLHVTDTLGILDDSPLSGSEGALSTDGTKRKRSEARQDNEDTLLETYEMLVGYSHNATVHVSQLARALNCSEKTVRNRISKIDNLVVQNGYVTSVI